MGRHWKQMGMTRLGDVPPPRIADVEQRAIAIDPDLALEPQLPRACPKCHATIPLTLRGRELHCEGTRGGCGASYYLTARTSRPVADLRGGRGRDKGNA